MSNTDNTHLWKMGNDSYIPIKDMDNNHLQKAVYFSEHKLKRILKSIENLQDEFDVFFKRRDNIFKEGDKRQISLESLIVPSEKKFKPLKDKLNDIRTNKRKTAEL